jgi:hypothetical protein
MDAETLDALTELRGNVGRLRTDNVELKSELRLHGARLASVEADVAALRADWQTGLSTVRRELDAGLTGLGDQLGQVRGELHSEIADLRGELRSQIAGLRGELRSDIADLRAETRAEFVRVRDEIADGRRHTQILYESLHDDVRIIAEGVVALSAKVDSLRPRE